MLNPIIGTRAFVERQREAFDQIFLALALGGSLLLALVQIAVVLAPSLWRDRRDGKPKEIEHRERHK